MSFRTVYGYSTSENGWRMCNRDECVIGGVIAGVPHSDTAPVRKGYAATILVAWMLYYHRHIERISSPVWGWSAENDVANSNHLSGTAVDINAPLYPWGYRTMPAARIAKVRKGLDAFNGVIYWGADWDRPDEMHYQLAYPERDGRIKALADKLDAGYLELYRPAPGALRVHTVARGETLSEIAGRYGVTVSRLAQENRIANVNVVRAGQRLTIPRP